MHNEQKYTIQGLEEYIRQGEPQQRERGEARLGRLLSACKSRSPKCKLAMELPLKCKNCTLEEAALLCIVQRKPTATQKEIAAEIGKSERTVKSITVKLQEKGVLRRVNGKRNGRWEINND